MEIYRIYGIEGNIEYGAEWDSTYNGMVCWAKNGETELNRFVAFPEKEKSIVPRKNNTQADEAWATVDSKINEMIEVLKNE